MTPSANLLPGAFLDARRRAQRVRAWVGAAFVALLAAGALAVAWVHAARALDRVTRRVAVIEEGRQSIERQLHASRAARDDALFRLRVLAAARRPQPWPAQLVALARSMPDGVVLTKLSVEPQASPTPAPAAAAPATPTGAPAAAAPTSSPAATTRPGASAARVFPVQLAGFASDHEQVSSLADRLRRLPGWGSVELTKAARQPLGGGHAVAFELTCRVAEDSP